MWVYGKLSTPRLTRHLMEIAKDKVQLGLFVFYNYETFFTYYWKETFVSNARD